MRYIGVHVSIAGGVHKSLKRAQTLDINAMQIFLKNSRKWVSPEYSTEDLDQYQSERRAFPGVKIFAHTGYLINLAARSTVFFKSFRGLIDEINRADSLGIDYLVLHPCNHKGEGESFAIRRIANSIDRILKRLDNSKLKILLETTAGSGTSIGYRFEHMRDIMDISKYSKRISVCLDTCHIFAAGYNISDEEGYHGTMKEFDRVIGLKKLKLIHLNDSKNELGSNIDRHEHIGRGFIGDAGFRLILNDERLKNIPMILETPKLIGESNSEVIQKDVPMILDKSRKFGFSFMDTILKDIPTFFDKSMRAGVSVTDSLLRNAIKTLDTSKRLGLFVQDTVFKEIQNIIESSRENNESISETLRENTLRTIENSKKIGSNVSDAIVKNIIRLLDNTKSSVFEVDKMNLEKVHSLIEKN